MTAALEKVEIKDVYADDPDHWFDEVARLLRKQLEYHAALDSPDPDEFKPELYDVEKDYIEMIADADEFSCLAAFADGEAIGVITLFVDPPTYIPAHIGHILDFYVEDKLRGCGVGGKLMERALEWFDARPHVRSVELEAWTDNEQVIPLYEKYGFEVRYHNMIRLNKDWGADSRESRRTLPSAETVEVSTEAIRACSPDIVLFDFDGTMLYTEDIHWKIFHDAIFKAFGIDYPFSEHWQCTGKAYREAWEFLGGKYGFGSDPNADKFAPDFWGVDMIAEVKGANRECYEYFPAAVSAAADYGAIVGSCSANSVKAISALLSEWDLNDKFSFVYSTAARHDAKADIVKAISSTVSGKVMLFEDWDHTIASCKADLGDKVVTVGIGHPLSWDKLAKCDACDVLLDVRDEVSSRPGVPGAVL